MRRIRLWLVLLALVVVTGVAASVVLASASGGRENTGCALSPGLYTYAEMVAGGCDVEPIPENLCTPFSGEDSTWEGFDSFEEAELALEHADAKPVCAPDPREVLYDIGVVNGSRPIIHD
jgi:hypothetical protein